MRTTSLVRPNVHLAEQQMLKKTRHISFPWGALSVPEAESLKNHLMASTQVPLFSYWKNLFFPWPYTEISEVCVFDLMATSSSSSVVAQDVSHAPDDQSTSSVSTQDWSVVGFGIGHFLFSLIPITGMVVNINSCQLKPQHTEAMQIVTTLHIPFFRQITTNVEFGPLVFHSQHLHLLPLPFSTLQRLPPCTYFCWCVR